MQDVGDGIRLKALRGLTVALMVVATGISVPAFATKRPYIVTSFDTIRVIAPVRVSVVTGGGVTARGEGNLDMLDRIDMTVSGRILTIKLRPPSPGDRAGPPPTLFLSTDVLSRVTLAGGGSLAIDRMKGLRGEIVLTGAGDVTVNGVAIDRLSVIVAGNGRVKLAGTTGMLSAIVSGAGTLEATELRVKQLKLTNDGPGETNVAADNTADIVARGSGNVTVTGKAACTVDSAGTGAIQCGGKAY